MGFLRELFWLSAIFNFRITVMHIPGISNPIADSISRLHDPLYLIKACKFLMPYYRNSIAYLLNCPLLLPLSVISCSFLFFRYWGRLLGQLQYEVFQYRFHTFADSTKGTYKTHLDCYIKL